MKKNNESLVIGFILITMLFPLLLKAQVYYVNNATEIKNIQSSLSPGDTVIMKNGEWQDQQITFSANGSVNDTIVLKSETPGYVILTGNSSLNFSGKYLKIDGLRFVAGYTDNNEVIGFRVGSKKAYHCRLTNCSIIDYNPENKSDGYKWVSVYGKNNRVDHCYFKGKTNEETTLVIWMPSSGDEVFHQIDHNYFGERPPLGKNGGETIRIGTSDYSMYDASCVVEDNYFERCNGEIEIISNKTGNNLFQRNTFYECKGTLTLRHGNGSTVRNNFFIGNHVDSTGGIRIIGERHKVYNNYLVNLEGTGFYSALSIMNGVPDSPLNRYFQVKNAVVAFNTIVNCSSSFVIGLGKNSERTLPPDSCTIANNIIDNPNNQSVIFEDTPTDFTWEGNIFWGNNTNIDTLNGVYFVDPQLSMSPDGLYRIDENSPAYNAASGNYDFVTDDMDGQNRDAIKDIGADEVSSLAIVNKPLTSDDVGPEWLKDTIPYWLSVKIKGHGSVNLNPEGNVYNPGTTVTLEAIPNTGSTFLGWEGDTLTTDNPITVVMNMNKEIIANFKDPVYYKLSYWINGSGTIQLSPDKSSYLENEQVIITAIPDSGWVFTEWGGALSGNENPDTLIMDSDKFFTAKFEVATSVNDKILKYDLNLEQNYPNPFNPVTTIGFNIDKSRYVKINVYNTLGEFVDNLFEGELNKGYYSVQWDGTNHESGIYFVRLITKIKTFTIKILLVK